MKKQFFLFALLCASFAPQETKTMSVGGALVRVLLVPAALTIFSGPLILIPLGISIPLYICTRGNIAKDLADSQDEIESYTITVTTKISRNTHLKETFTAADPYVVINTALDYVQHQTDGRSFVFEPYLRLKAYDQLYPLRTLKKKKPSNRLLSKKNSEQYWKSAQKKLTHYFIIPATD